MRGLRTLHPGVSGTDQRWDAAKAGRSYLEPGTGSAVDPAAIQAESCFKVALLGLRGHGGVLPGGHGLKGPGDRSRVYVTGLGGGGQPGSDGKQCDRWRVLSGAKGGPKGSGYQQ